MLSEVDVAGGKGATRLYPPEGTKVNISGAAYAPGGRQVYVATDEGKEGYSMLALDVKSKAVKGRYVVDNPSTASIGPFQVSPRGDRIAVGIDEGNHVEVRILDAKRLTVQRTLKTPLGLANIGPFTDDGRSFTFWQATFNHPADPFLQPCPGNQRNEQWRRVTKQNGIHQRHFLDRHKHQHLRKQAGGGAQNMQPGARCSQLGNTFAKSPGREQQQADEVLKQYQNTGGYILRRLAECTHHRYAGEREHNQQGAQHNRTSRSTPCVQSRFVQCSLSSK